MALQEAIRSPVGISNVVYDEGKGKSQPCLRVESKDGIRQIPVYSVRDPSQHESIAKCMASGSVVAFEVGVMGIMIAINDPRDPRDGRDNWKKFWEVKKGRGQVDKVPMLMLPKYDYTIVDFDKLHPDYRYLKDPQERHKFFGSLPLHVILPFRESVKNVNRNAFVTTSEESKKKPADQHVQVSTICIYFQGGDKVWEDIAEKAKHYNPYVHFGISSLNDHGEHSPYDFDELIEYVKRKQRVDFEFVVRDPIVAKHKIRSSMTQVRLPLKDETPEIRIIRKGPVSAEMIAELTGHPVRILESAKFAGRGYPEDVPLGENVLGYIKEANNFTQQRKK